jgi:hypothetical protein
MVATHMWMIPYSILNHYNTKQIVESLTPRLQHSTIMFAPLSEPFDYWDFINTTSIVFPNPNNLIAFVEPEYWDHDIPGKRLRVVFKNKELYKMYCLLFFDTPPLAAYDWYQPVAIIAPTYRIVL